MLKVAMPRLELAETRCEIWAMSTAELYEEDFLLWTKEQARLLREAAERGVNLPLDWENLAEEARAWAVRTAASCAAASPRSSSICSSWSTRARANRGRVGAIRSTAPAARPS